MTSIRYLGDSGRKGMATSDTNAGTALRSSRYGHSVFVPVDTHKQTHAIVPTAG